MANNLFNPKIRSILLAACLLAVVSGACAENSTCVPVCDDGYVMVNNSTSCPTGCNTCSTPSYCTSCLPSRYSYLGGCYASCPSGTLTSGTHCDQCSSSCANCTGNTTTCTSCNSNRYFYSTNSSCLASCPDGTYINGSNCTNCTSPCSKCDGPSNSTNCIQCVSGYLHHNSGCYAQCPMGTFQQSGACSECNPACAICTGPQSTQCSSCKPNYYFHQPNSACYSACPPPLFTSGNLCVESCPAGTFEYGMSCQGCADNCSSCNGPATNQCTACNTAFLYYENSCYEVCPDGTYSNGAECKVCAVPCATCFGGSSSQCNSCKPNFYYHSQSCVDSCPSGTIEMGSSCESCSEGCATCTGTAADQCLTCLTPYLYYMNGCYSTCPDGAYTSTSGSECLACSNECETCMGPGATNCNSCSLGYLYYSHNCVTSCPDGMYESFGQCLPCDDTCATCSVGGASGCTSCSDGRFLSVTSCVTTCPGGFYPEESDNKCHECDNSCATCIAGTAQNCTGCSGLLYLYEMECIPVCPDGTFANTTDNICQDCDPSCKTCHGATSTDCLTCHSTAYFNDGACVNPCPSNMYPNNTDMTCKPCASVCETCSGPTSAECNSCVSPLYLHQTSCTPTCPAGTYLDSAARKCLGCDATCKTCNGPTNTSCLSCTSSYFYYAFSCYTTCPQGTYANTTTLKCLNCHASCTACNGPSNSHCSACSPSYYFLAAQQLCTTSCPPPYSPITQDRTCAITKVDSLTLNETLHPQITSALSASPPLSLFDEGTFLKGVTDTITQFKITNYGTTTAACPDCSGNGDCKNSELYLKDFCFCSSGWIGDSCNIPQTDVSYLQSLDRIILDEIASKVSQGISLKTTSLSQSYLDSLLKIVSTPPILLEQVQQVMSIISSIVNSDFSSKTPSDNFDDIKMTIAAQIIDYCMQYIHNTDCYLQQSSSQSLFTSATTILTLIGSLQLWNKDVNSNHTIDCTDYQLFATRVYQSDLNGLVISPPNQPSIVLKGGSSLSTDTTPVDIQVLFWKNNLLSCPSVQKEDSTPPPISLAVNMQNTVQFAEISKSLSADISYPVTNGQKYTNCSSGCTFAIIQGANDQMNYQCKCGTIESLSVSRQAANIFERSNIFKLAQAAALATFNYLGSWAFWMLWGISVWIILTIISIKWKIISPLIYRAYRKKKLTEKDVKKPQQDQESMVPENLRSFKLEAGIFKTILYGLKYGHPFASIYFFEDGLFPRVKRAVLLYCRLLSLMAFSSIFNFTATEEIAENGEKVERSSFTDTLILMALPLGTVVPLNLILKLLLVSKVKSKTFILKSTRNNAALRDKELEKRRKMIKIAKIKEIIGYMLALGVLGAATYMVLVVAANSDAKTSQVWALNFLTSVAQDMGVTQVVKVLITITLIKIIAKGQSPKTVKLLRMGIDPIIIRALALAFYKPGKLLS